MLFVACVQMTYQLFSGPFSRDRAVCLLFADKLELNQHRPVIGSVKRRLVIADFVLHAVYAGCVEHMIDGELGQIFFGLEPLAMPLAVLAASVPEILLFCPVLASHLSSD